MINLSRTARRVAVAATSAAVAGTALVGATSGTAHAATVTTDYTCSLGNLYSGTFPLTVTGDLPVDDYWAGAAVPAGLLNVQAAATVPADAAGLLSAAGVTGAESRDFAFKVGSATARVPLSGAFTTDGGVTTWNGEGSNATFVTPNPTSAPVGVVLPNAFKLTTKQGDEDSAELSCAVASGTTPASVDTIGFLKQTATKVTVTKKTIKVKKGKKAVVPVSVTSNAAPTLGKVTAAKGSKKLGQATLKNGKAKIKLGKLPVGTHKVTVKLVGSPALKAATTKVTIKVVK
ncbi:Ig-like domain repeat protein [Nocardioides marmotae]|uniref:Ig-like domain repeat protein n=1 Tax=Nocardioides marmotae TaxID=2663857 RepID=UPI0012B51BB4|nr:Ig-like domain repeat protein [Nocardioides marmotae]MBC9734500.1 hypothetical protein [Nocardioides marmotae]MTB85600.1 hypothetical protein [Nocardioides marmotae]